MFNKLKLKRDSTLIGVMLLMASTITPIFTMNGNAYASFENGNQVVCVPSTSTGLDGDISKSDNNGGGDGSESTDLGVIPKQQLADAKAIATFLNQKYGFGQDQLASIMATAWRESNWKARQLRRAVCLHNKQARNHQNSARGVLMRDTVLCTMLGDL